MARHLTGASNGIKYGITLYLVLFVSVLQVEEISADGNAPAKKEYYQKCLKPMGEEGTDQCVKDYVKKVNEAMSWENLLTDGSKVVNEYTQAQVYCNTAQSDPECKNLAADDKTLVEEYMAAATDCFNTFNGVGYQKNYADYVYDPLRPDEGIFRYLDLATCPGVDEKIYKQFEKELAQAKKDEYVKKNTEFCCYVQTQMFCYENLVITKGSPLGASFFMKLLGFARYKYSRKMELCDIWNDRATCGDKDSGMKLKYNVYLVILCLLIQYVIYTYLNM